MFDLNIFEMALLLLAAHFLCDYAWQGDWMAKAKSSEADFGMGRIWWHVLLGHSIIHGAAVYLILGVWWLALAEIAVHFGVDYAKCGNRISYDQDQAIHIVSKALWLLLMVGVG